MSDDQPFYAPAYRPPPARKRRVGELLFEFYVESTKKFYRCELFDHGEWGVEPQFLDPIDPTIARLFHPQLDPTRTPREMAIAWAIEERKAIENGYTDQ
jgi:hypothetical protein